MFKASHKRFPNLPPPCWCATDASTKGRRRPGINEAMDFVEDSMVGVMVNPNNKMVYPRYFTITPVSLGLISNKLRSTNIYLFLIYVYIRVPRQPGGANFSGKNTIYKPKKDFAHRKRAQPRTSALPKLIFFARAILQPLVVFMWCVVRWYIILFHSQTTALTLSRLQG